MSLSSKSGANKSCNSSSSSLILTGHASSVAIPLSSRDKVKSALKLFSKPSTSSSAAASSSLSVFASCASSRARKRVSGARKSCAKLSLTWRVASISFSSWAKVALMRLSRTCHSTPPLATGKRADKSPCMTGLRPSPIASTRCKPRRAKNAPPTRPISNMASKANAKACRKLLSKVSPSAIS